MPTGAVLVGRFINPDPSPVNIPPLFAVKPALVDVKDWAETFAEKLALVPVIVLKNVFAPVIV